MKNRKPKVKRKTPIADEYAQRIEKIKARLGDVPFSGGTASETVVAKLRDVISFVEKGEEQVRNLDTGRQKSAEKRKERREQLRQERRKFALSEWPKNPNFTRLEMAGHIRIENSDPDAVSTIENDIKGIKARALRNMKRKTE